MPEKRDGWCPQGTTAQQQWLQGWAQSLYEEDGIFLVRALKGT